MALIDQIAAVCADKAAAKLRLKRIQLRGKLKRGHAVHHRKAMLGPDVLAERLLKGLQMLALRQRFRVPHGFHDHSDLVFGVLDRTSAEIDFDVHKMSCL